MTKRRVVFRNVCSRYISIAELWRPVRSCGGWFGSTEVTSHLLKSPINNKAVYRLGDAPWSTMWSAARLLSDPGTNGSITVICVDSWQAVRSKGHSSYFKVPGALTLTLCVVSGPPVVSSHTETTSDWSPCCYCVPYDKSICTSSDSHDSGSEKTRLSMIRVIVNESWEFSHFVLQWSHIWQCEGKKWKLPCLHPTSEPSFPSDSLVAASLQQILSKIRTEGSSS